MSPVVARYNIGECRFLPTFEKRYREDWCGQFVSRLDDKEKSSSESKIKTES